jgi:hypothetical protein
VSRRLLRLAIGAAAAVLLLLAAGATSASAAPEVTVSQTANLDPDGEVTLTVEGSGFDPAGSGGNGIYLAFGPKNADYQTNAAAYYEAKWVHTGAAPSPGQAELNADGTFSTTIKVKARYTDGGGTDVDCLADACYVLTIGAHGIVNPGQETFTRIRFQPILTVTPSTNLDADGDTVAISGEGFWDIADPEHGLYVTQAAIIDGRVRTTGPRQVSPDPSTPTMWQLETDGTFSGSLPVVKTFTSGGVTVDCAFVQCEIVTFRARTNPTPATLFTRQPISFEPVPAVQVSPATDLSRAGDTVTVEGADFLASLNATGAYVAQGAEVDGQLVYRGAQWFAPAGVMGASGTIDADGRFTTTIDVVGAGTFTVRGGGGATREVDCAEVQCSIVTWSAHSAAQQPLFATATPIAFAAATPDPDPDPGPGGGGGGGGAPAISVTPSSGLTGPATVSVTGSGFSTTPPGIYVVYGPMAGNTNPAAYYGPSSQFLTPGGGLSASGTFTTSMQVVPSYTDGNGNAVDCTVVQCYVRTMRAHGMTDVNQDTAVPITFASSVTASAQRDAGPAPAPASGPVASTTGPATGAPSGTAPATLPAITKPSVRRNGRVSLTVSEPSTVTFVLRRKRGKRWVVVKVVRVRVAEAGTVRAKLPLRRAGRYRISAKAVSSVTGKASKKTVKRVTVKRSKKKGARR